LEYEWTYQNEIHEVTFWNEWEIDVDDLYFGEMEIILENSETILWGF